MTRTPRPGHTRRNRPRGPPGSAPGRATLVPGRATLVPGPRLTLSLRRGAAERAHAPCGGAGGGDSGRGWAAPVFWGLGAVGGAGSLTVVTTAPPPPRLAGLWTVIAFGGRGALAVVSGNNPPQPLSDTRVLPTPPSPPPCKGRMPDTSKGDDSPRLGPTGGLAGGHEDVLRGSWG